MSRILYVQDFLIGDYIEYDPQHHYCGYIMQITSLNCVILSFDARQLISFSLFIKYDYSIQFPKDFKLVRRQLQFSSSRICGNCNVLKQFPESCTEICPNRKSPESINFFIKDRMNDSMIEMISFMDEDGVPGDFGEICKIISGYLPKPPYPYVDLSEEGLKNVLENQVENKLYERIYIKFSNTNAIYSLPELELKNSKYLSDNIENNSIYKVDLCSWCIFNSCSDCEKEFNCKLKSLLMKL